jgi:small subunit ribosomal protein S8
MSYMSDPIADMLVRVKNAYVANKDTVDIPFSKLKGEIARILEREGFIRSHEVKKNEGIQGVIKIHLRYNNKNMSAINGIRKISRPGLRVYTEKNNIPRAMGGLGIVIVSTSRGVFTDAEAREAGIGGEVICSVW